MTDIHKRERTDPDESTKPLPGLLVMFVGAALMWGSFYIYSTDSGDQSAFGDQRTLGALMPRPAPAGDSVDGKAIFSAKCAACHQATGQGVAGVFPPLVNSEWVIGEPNILGQILLHGIEGKIVVLGKEYSGAMPAFGSQLTDAEIAGVMTYIRKEWGNSATSVDASAVSKWREQSATIQAPFKGQAQLEAFIKGGGG